MNDKSTNMERGRRHKRKDDNDIIRREGSIGEGIRRNMEKSKEKRHKEQEDRSRRREKNIINTIIMVGGTLTIFPISLILGTLIITAIIIAIPTALVLVIIQTIKDRIKYGRSDIHTF